MGDYEKAQGAFDEAIRLEPKAALFWNNLAATYREQDRLEEAERILLEEVLPLDATLPVAHLNLGIIYQRGGRPDMAVRHLQEALALLPPEERGEAQARLAELEEPGPWLDLGARFLANQEPEAALAAYEQADRLGAAVVDVIPGASRALIELDALADAEALISRILEQAPDDARLYVNLGLIAQQQGNTDAAREYYERAARLAPQWEEPQELLQSLGSQ
jgi:tetratricopeptide (TPR) repeat protein